MSGPELILGILPLLISAAEHWDDCIRPFKRYRKFTTEVDRFQQRLKVQNVIFWNQCRILLENVVKDEGAEQMLAEPKHPSWKDPEIEDRLAAHLAESRDACLATIELIEEKLGEVQEESQDLGAIVAQDQGIVTQDRKTWRCRVAKKLRFSFSKSRLDENLANLRSLNDDFRTLSSQSTKPHVSIRAPSHNTKKEVQICQTIGKVSRQVYNALSKACTKHTEHLAHFDLRVEHRPCEDPAIPDLKFKMAFTHLTLAGMSQGEPMWFAVDSIIEGSDPPGQLDNVPGLDQLTGSLKRQCSASQDPEKKQSKKRVRFQTSTPPTASGVTSVHVPTALFSMPSIRKDFCDYLRQYMSQQNSKIETPMAVLEVADGCKHLVYPSPSTLASNNKHAVSLQQYISSLPKNQDRCATFPQYQRLRLAKALATAVLQYHGTPWLKLTWRSEDVVFFGQKASGDSTDSILDLAVPHLNVKVKGPDGQNLQTTCFPRNLAPNSILFGLGVVLLEIAYSATLESLQQPSDLCAGVDTSFAEFFTAKRLASSIGRELGSSYGKVVKKLLQCDFGCGDDLNEPDLQAGYYKDVVCELGRLEQGFRQLQLGSD